MSRGTLNSDLLEELAGCCQSMNLKNANKWNMDQKVGNEAPHKTEATEKMWVDGRKVLVELIYNLLIVNV